MERGSALGSKQRMLIAGGREMGRWMIGPGKKEGYDDRCDKHGAGAAELQGGIFSEMRPL